MSKPGLLVTHNKIPQEIIDKLAEKFDVQIIDKKMNGTTKRDLLDKIPGMFALLTCAPIAIDDDVITAAGPSLRVVSTTSMGYELIDTESLKKHGIFLGNTTHATAHRVAECTVGLLIATANRLLYANEQIKRGKLPKSMGMGVTNSAVGIVGCGNIGVAVAEMLRGFKLRALLYTSRTPKARVERLGGQMVSVDDVVRRCDFIILTGILVPETEFTINERRLALMKPNAIVINVGRGKLIDQDALIDALREKRIRGAGLDVMTPEPLPLDNPLMTMENVVLLPHIAGRNTIEAIMEKTQLAADNILAVINNQPMPCQVQLQQ